MSIMPIDLGRENDPDYEYIPDPMGRLGRGRWRRRRKFDPFGRIEINPEFENFRDGFDLTKPVGNIFRGRPPELVAPVGREGENERFDVALIETLLAKTGFFDLAPTEGPTGYYGSDLDDAIRRFQKTANLKVDGLVNPGGPTLGALTARLAAAEGAGDGGGDRDKDPEGGEHKPVNLLEEAMRRGKRGGMLPPTPGDILDDGFPGGGAGGARGRKPLPPPIMPGGDLGRPDSGRPPAEAESDADQARREAVADEFVKEITKPLESHRGNDTTKKGNDIVVRECRDILKKEFPDLIGKIEHIGGATKDGSGNEEDKLSEMYLPNEKGPDRRRGSSHPDLTWQHKDGDQETRAHANTVTTRGDGRTLTDWEQHSLDSLIEKAGAELVTQIPKLRPGEDEDDYREMAREKCREIFGKLRDKLDKTGDEEPDSESDEP